MAWVWALMLSALKPSCLRLADRSKRQQPTSRQNSNRSDSRNPIDLILTTLVRALPKASILTSSFASPLQQPCKSDFAFVIKWTMSLFCLTLIKGSLPMNCSIFDCVRSLSSLIFPCVSPAQPLVYVSCIAIRNRKQDRSRDIYPCCFEWTPQDKRPISNSNDSSSRCRTVHSLRSPQAIVSSHPAITNLRSLPHKKLQAP